MGKKSSKAPNVVGAAETEGQYSRETARDVTYADRPDQFGPMGNVQWSQEQVRDPGTGEMVTKWIQNQTMSGDTQAIFDPMMRSMGDRAQMSAGMMGRIQDEMGDAPDWAQFGDVEGFDPAQQRQAAEDASYSKSAMRLDPRFAREGESLDIQLRNQGLRPGDQSYDAQMESFNFGKNDAYENARLGATAEGRDEFGVSLQGNERANALRNQQIQEYLAKRNFSLNEADSLNPTGDLQALSSTVSGA